MRNYTKVKKLTALTTLIRQSTEPRLVDLFVRANDLNTLTHFIFSPISFGSSRVVLIQLPMSDF